MKLPKTVFVHIEGDKPEQFLVATESIERAIEDDGPTSIGIYELKKIDTYEKRAVKKQRGVILVEAAMVFPVFLFLILMSLDLILAAGNKAGLTYLVGQAAICEASGKCNAYTYMHDNAAGVAMNRNRLTVHVNGMAVEGVYVYQPVGPFFPALTFTASAVAVAP